MNNKGLNMKKIRDAHSLELWQHLHWLSVLAQQGSYTAAAARLGVSKAAMSQRIAELERTRTGCETKAMDAAGRLGTAGRDPETPQRRVGVRDGAGKGGLVFTGTALTNTGGTPTLRLAGYDETVNFISGTTFGAVIDAFGGTPKEGWTGAAFHNVTSMVGAGT